MELLQPRFPYSVGGNPIPFLRIVKQNEKGQVVKVTSPYNKEGQVIAVCAVETRTPGECYLFTTAPGYVGHRDLCRLLYRNGIRGKYSEWLKAVEAGDERLAEEKEHLSVIRFECDLIEDEEAAGWKIKSGEEVEARSETPVDVRERIKKNREKSTEPLAEAQ